MAGDKKDKKGAATEINWLTFDELQVAMKKEPRKVYVDVYTDWCGWCKVMDKKTFSNPEVIRYMNEKFYAVKFNAERKDTIRFMGKSYYFDPQYKANTLAVELMQGKMSYPTSIFTEDNFMNPQPVPGFLEVPKIEMILKFLGDNIYKSQPFEEYSKNFKGSWASAQ